MKLKLSYPTAFAPCQMFQWPHGQAAIALDGTGVGHFFPYPEVTKHWISISDKKIKTKLSQEKKAFINTNLKSSFTLSLFI